VAVRHQNYTLILPLPKQPFDTRKDILEIRGTERTPLKHLLEYGFWKVFCCTHKQNVRRLIEDYHRKLALNGIRKRPCPLDNLAKPTDGRSTRVNGEDRIANRGNFSSGNVDTEHREITSAIRLCHFPHLDNDFTLRVCIRECERFSELVPLLVRERRCESRKVRVSERTRYDGSPMHEWLDE
jgi:hypothetical protein